MDWLGCTVERTAYLAFSEVYFSQDLGYQEWRHRRPSRERCEVGTAPGLPPLPPASQLEELFPPGMGGLLGNRPASRPITKALGFASTDLPAAQRCELKRALAFTVDHPRIVAESVARRFYGFWGPNSFLLRWVALGIYPRPPLTESAYPVIKWLVIVFHMGVVGAAIMAVGSRPRDRLVVWSGLFFAYYTAVHMLAVSYSRYRLPLMPLVVVLASLWLGSPQAPRGRLAKAVTAAVLLGFLALCVHYVAFRLP